MSRTCPRCGNDIFPGGSCHSCSHKERQEEARQRQRREEERRRSEEESRRRDKEVRLQEERLEIERRQQRQRNKEKTPGIDSSPQESQPVFQWLGILIVLCPLTWFWAMHLHGGATSAEKGNLPMTFLIGESIFVVVLYLFRRILGILCKWAFIIGIVAVGFYIATRMIGK